MIPILIMKRLGTNSQCFCYLSTKNQGKVLEYLYLSTDMDFGTKSWKAHYLQDLTFGHILVTFCTLFTAHWQSTLWADIFPQIFPTQTFETHCTDRSAMRGGDCSAVFENDFQWFNVSTCNHLAPNVGRFWCVKWETPADKRRWRLWWRFPAKKNQLDYWNRFADIVEFSRWEIL